MAVTSSFVVFWVVTPVLLLVVTNVSEERREKLHEYTSQPSKPQSTVDQFVS
jgi:hypothetical protein